MVAHSAARPVINVLRVNGLPILRQLQLEEALLRADDRNWCIINDGAKTPAVVMGISGKPAQLLELPAVIRDRLQVIKRFSGGGTVVVDGGTVFVTLICSTNAVPGLVLYPRPIMQWTEQFYLPVFEKVPGFELREHDYVFGEKKFGGNAQSITKNRWLHHTSFLWDYRDHNMAYLKLPQKAPEYRQGRSHGAFITRMKDYIDSRQGFLDSVEQALVPYFQIKAGQLGDVEAVSTRRHPQSTKVLDLDELKMIYNEG